MTNNKAMYQLESLKIHCQIMAEEHSDEPDNIWATDVEALTMAISALSNED